jgi:hypothetical protein
MDAMYMTAVSYCFVYSWYCHTPAFKDIIISYPFLVIRTSCTYVLLLVIITKTEDESVLNPRTAVCIYYLLHVPSRCKYNDRTKRFYRRAHRVEIIQPAAAVHRPHRLLSRAYNDRLLREISFLVPDESITYYYYYCYCARRGPS